MVGYAVLWDLNGVIIDDMQIHLKSFQAVLREFGHDMSNEYLVAKCVGTPPREVFADILPGLGNPLPIEEAVSRKRDYYFALIKGNMQMLPGVSELLDGFRAAGFKQAIASGATKIEVEAILEEFGIRGIFEAVVASEDVSAGKPDPEPFLTAAARLCVEPGRCLVIEDGEYGVRAAKTSGMKAIAVLNTQTRADLVAADMIVESLEDVTVERLQSLMSGDDAVSKVDCSLQKN